jgi:hypothetical protein
MKLAYRVMSSNNAEYTFEELNPHACGFIASKCYPSIDFKTVQSTVSNLQWCNGPFSYYELIEKAGIIQFW